MSCSADSSSLVESCGCQSWPRSERRTGGNVAISQASRRAWQTRKGRERDLTEIDLASPSTRYRLAALRIAHTQHSGACVKRSAREHARRWSVLASSGLGTLVLAYQSTQMSITSAAGCDPVVCPATAFGSAQRRPQLLAFHLCSFCPSQFECQSHLVSPDRLLDTEQRSRCPPLSRVAPSMWLVSE